MTGDRGAKEQQQNRGPAVFARKATGLVREVSLFDAFVFNLAANPIGLALVFILGLQMGLFPGADPVVAMIIVIVVSLFIAATYALFSSAFPRSGGDYVFNSRLLHPSLGFGFNLSLSFWEWLTASLSLSFITTLGLSPIAVMLGYLTGEGSLVSLGVTLAEPRNILLIGTVLNVILAFLFLVGTKRTIGFINFFYVASFIGLVLIIAALLGSSPSIFQSNLDNFLHAIGSSQTYSGLIGAASAGGMQISSGYAFNLLPAMVGVVSIEAIWYFWSSYIGGEVKRGNSLKRQSISMLGAAAFNGILTLVAIVLYFHVVGRDFITAFSYLLASSPSSVPFGPATVSGDQIVIFASLATNNSLIALLIPILFVGWIIVQLADFAVQPVRSLFAWSMDRVLPSKFSEVSGRFHAPTYPVIVGAIVMEVGLVAQVFVTNAVLLIFTASIVAPAFSSMFITGLSGVIMPLRRKELFNSSGLGRLRVGRIPLVSITGAVTAGYILFLVFVFFSYPGFGLRTPILAFLAFGINVIGIAIYFVAREYRRKREGIDIDNVFQEMPPE